MIQYLLCLHCPLTPTCDASGSVEMRLMVDGRPLSYASKGLCKCCYPRCYMQDTSKSEQAHRPWAKFPLHLFTSLSEIEISQAVTAGVEVSFCCCLKCVLISSHAPKWRMQLQECFFFTEKGHFFQLSVTAAELYLFIFNLRVMKKLQTVRRRSENKVN